MYIYTTTTNCPLATQPPPDSTYHCSFDLSFKPDPVDIGFINRRCPSQIQTRWTFMKISQIGDFVYFFSQCRPLENQICTFKKPGIQGVYSSCHPNIFPQRTTFKRVNIATPKPSPKFSLEGFIISSLTRSLPPVLFEPSALKPDQGLSSQLGTSYQYPGHTQSSMN